MERLVRDELKICGTPVPIYQHECKVMIVRPLSERSITHKATFIYLFIYLFIYGEACDI